ncbi:MAG: NrdH-redoxin [Propionibacteriaceae bacterium]|nr:NrdH-redoxin [Propionibacteriaceae bacterium]
MASASGTTDQFSNRIVMYGADWCRDCRNAKTVFETEGVAFDYIDLVDDESAAARAEQISGSKHIPVVVFPDGFFMVEPTALELIARLVIEPTDVE